MAADTGSDRGCGVWYMVAGATLLMRKQYVIIKPLNERLYYFSNVACTIDNGLLHSSEFK